MRPGECQELLEVQAKGHRAQTRLMEEGRDKERRLYRLLLTGLTTTLAGLIIRLSGHV